MYALSLVRYFLKFALPVFFIFIMIQTASFLPAPFSAVNLFLLIFLYAYLSRQTLSLTTALVLGLGADLLYPASQGKYTAMALAIFFVFFLFDLLSPKETMLWMGVRIFLMFTAYFGFSVLFLFLNIERASVPLLFRIEPVFFAKALLVNLISFLLLFSAVEFYKKYLRQENL